MSERGSEGLKAPHQGSLERARMNAGMMGGGVSMGQQEEIDGFSLNKYRAKWDQTVQRYLDAFAPHHGMR